MVCLLLLLLLLSRCGRVWLWECAQTPYAEILMALILGGGACARWLGHEGGALIHGISALVKEALEGILPLPPWEDTVKRHYLRESGLSPDFKSWGQDPELSCL